MEVVFYFDQVSDDQIECGARRPAGQHCLASSRDLFAAWQERPNNLEVAVARLIARHGRQLTLRGLDAIDGTPVLEIKPLMREFLPAGDIIQPAWSQELMIHHWH